MRYSAQHKEETRRRILDAAARRFRAEGYDGLGVDGLAKAAGVTNGAFYGHFATKEAAFREVVVMGLSDLRAGIENYRAQHGPGWLEPFARFYLSHGKLTDAEITCALPSFAPEVARASPDLRSAFEAELLRVVATVADGLGEGPADAREARAWTVLTLLSGGVSLARALSDQTAVDRLIGALLPAVLAAATETE